MKILQIVAFRGATAFEFQCGRVWFKFLRPRFWRNGIRHLITAGVEENE